MLKKDKKDKKDKMNFKESVQYYLGTKKESVNEMALKHLAGTDEKWKEEQISSLGYKNFYKEYECRIDTLNDLYAEIESLKKLIP
jgi:uncharacterized membrane protein YcaP (DUF421 family)